MKLEIISQKPKGALHTTPLLFVHGAWHGAWCWENFLPYFAGHGYESHAVSLRGHGNSEGREKIQWHSAAKDYVADVAQVINSMSTPPVIIGHSMGGYVAQKYLEAYSAPAAVLLASIPSSGIFGFGIRFMLRHPFDFLKAHVTLSPWHIVSSPQLMKDAFFSDDLSDEELARHFSRLQAESFQMEVETMLTNLPRPQLVKTPMLVLAAENDHVFSVKEEQATARAYHTTAEIFPNMAHDMMLERDWQKAADRILNWLQERGI